MLSSEVAQSLKSYGHCSNHWVGRAIVLTIGSGSLSVIAMLDFLGKEDTSIHGVGEDDTANIKPPSV